jgi:hypothetical protein
MNVRTFLAMLTLMGGCHQAARCGTCGMKIDPSSYWVAYADSDSGAVPFDTPRCAFIAWHERPARFRGVHFREYYSHDLLASTDLLFVAGSDVVGPMGADLVPVARDKAGKFARDHNGAPPKTTDDLLQEGAP